MFLDIAIHKIQYINQFSPLRWVFNYQNFIVYSNYYIRLSTREKHALPDVHSFDVWRVPFLPPCLEHPKYAHKGVFVVHNVFPLPFPIEIDNSVLVERTILVVTY